MGHAIGDIGGGIRVIRSAISFGALGFFSRRRASHPDAHLTELADFTPKMLGSNASRSLKTKASDTWSILLCCIDLLAVKGGCLGADRGKWSAGADTLFRYIELCRASPRDMTRPQIQELHDIMIRHLGGAR